MITAKHTGAIIGRHFPRDAISYAVWACLRFSMSLGDVKDLLAERAIVVSYETVRTWIAKFDACYAGTIRRDRATPSYKRHPDEVATAIREKKHWLWRTVDSSGKVLDILVQSRRDKTAADRLFHKLIKQYDLP